jgi:hypothetical protein
MGREAETIAHWGGVSAPVKALLESDALILRGGIKARLPRVGLTEIAVDGCNLRLKASGAPLVLELGNKVAASWLAALLKPLPTLASKLGIASDRPAFLVAVSSVAELEQALAGATVADPHHATQLIAVLTSPAELDCALTLAATHPHLPIWCVYAKGKAADPGDGAVRNAFRSAGWMDNKTCAVSAIFTATRYTRRG